MRSLLERVDDVLISHREPSIALTALCAIAPLSQLLSSFRADASSLAVLASRSYRHRNGFDKIVLAAPSGSPLKLVLHVWLREGLEDSDNIHDHRWDFSSVVVCGALRLEFYDRDTEGRTYSVMQYRPLPGVGKFEFHSHGSTAVSAHASVTMTVGSTYSWACDRLHRAWGLPGQVTATLLVQGPPTRGSTNVLVYGDNGQQLDGPQNLYRLRADEVDRTLAALVRENMETVRGLVGHQSSEHLP